ncbi:MAG: hypothetical protein ACOCQD_00270 [archaeon]
MVELTTAGGKQGIRECISMVTDKSNLPAYGGIGVGAVAGNVVAKELDNLYTDKFVENPDSTGQKVAKFLVRTIGRVGVSAGACAIGGNMEGQVKTFMNYTAIGSTGVAVLDAGKTFLPDQIGKYADLGVNMSRYRGSAGGSKNLSQARARPVSKSRATARAEPNPPARVRQERRARPQPRRVSADNVRTRTEPVARANGTDKIRTQQDGLGVNNSLSMNDRIEPLTSGLFD